MLIVELFPLTIMIFIQLAPCYPALTQRHGNLWKFRNLWNLCSRRISISLPKCPIVKLWVITQVLNNPNLHVDHLFQRLAPKLQMWLWLARHPCPHIKRLCKSATRRLVQRHENAAIWFIDSYICIKHFSQTKFSADFTWKIVEIHCYKINYHTGSVKIQQNSRAKQERLTWFWQFPELLFLHELVGTTTFLFLYMDISRFNIKLYLPMARCSN